MWLEWNVGLFFKLIAFFKCRLLVCPNLCLWTHSFFEAIKWWEFTTTKYQTLRNLTNFLKTWKRSEILLLLLGNTKTSYLRRHRSSVKGAFSKWEKNLEASELLIQRDRPYKPYWRRNSRIIESCQVSGRQLAAATGHYCHIWQCLQACQVRNRVQRLRLSCSSLQLYYKQAWRGWEGLLR